VSVLRSSTALAANRCTPYRIARSPNPAAAGSPVWTFNGDLERPTFEPSLLCDQHDPAHRCHLFLRQGRIEYLSDCHHALAGQTVECPEWNDDLW
jgi:hypothetical protein